MCGCRRSRSEAIPLGLAICAERVEPGADVPQSQGLADLGELLG